MPPRSPASSWSAGARYASCQRTGSISTAGSARPVGPPASCEAPMKILISADMEGTAGVSSWVQVTPAEGRSARPTSSAEYERARRRMTREVNAAIEGAFDGGATDVIVTDAHGGKRNLVPDELDRRARFVTGTDNELGMMQAIDEEGIRAVFFTGYHAKAGTPGGPLAHTSTGWVHDVRVDGISMGEYG